MLAVTRRLLSPSLISRIAPLRSLSTAAADNEDGKFTFDLFVERSEDKQPLAAFRVMNKQGQIIDPKYDPKVDEGTTVRLYKEMIQLNVMDTILYEAQRQGRISFYMTSFGEEATHMGSAVVFSPEDVVYGQYRETGVLLHRGFTIEQCIDQCFSNEFDLGKGRQMPVHYGSAKINFQTISSPLLTQLPQATGAAYSLKFEGKKACVVCYFGEGAASEGDFHPALNFAATLDCPVIFFCRNNGYAISTPAKEQYRGDGIASRGIGYGMATMRVDGNDIWAVYHATKEARRIAVEEGKPVLIEAMTYRVGHHSTSDDSTRYRTSNEVEFWKKRDNPLTRLRLYMEERNWWDAAREKEYQSSTLERVLTALRTSETHKKPALTELFTDVYDVIPKHLLEQQKEVNEHLAKYASEYDLHEFKSV
eukprot:TRINITY_DN1717_c0_g1_i1.p1 TRINITY_DN1717_c0_g1~~TRINITY_DN1717_c0_g1_i1.p1  ORF type:complete len:421 (+),score=188.65 TRINITY_DN1717_c0_g1_i1:34-1296(+)